MMDENKWNGHTAKEQRLGDGCTGCAFDRANGRDEQCPHHNGGPSCLPFDRVDKRSVIWISDVPAPEKPEPKVVFATVRDDFDSDGLESGWSLECRFDDNQKYGAVTIDRPFPELAHRICDFLNSPQELKITLSENEKNEALRAISESTTPVTFASIPSAQNDDPMSKAIGRHIEMVACEDDERLRRKLIELGWTPPDPHAQVLGAEYPTFIVPNGKGDKQNEPDLSEVEKYLHGAPTPDEIEAFHEKGHVIIHKDLWEATRAMAEAFITEPEPGDAKELWEVWTSNVEKFRKQYEELRTEEP